VYCVSKQRLFISYLLLANKTLVQYKILR